MARFPICTKIIFVILLVVLDLVAVTVLFVHGNKWEIYRQSLVNYKFATSFLELCFFAYLRGSVVLGGVIGSLCNLSVGPKRCKNSIWLMNCLVCINVYYACAKLLAFSESSNFVAGPDLYWFLSLFVWNLIGSSLTGIQWHILSTCEKLQEEKFNVISNNQEPIGEENQPLLGGIKDRNNAGLYSSFNQDIVSNFQSHKTLSSEISVAGGNGSVTTGDYHVTFSDESKTEKTSKPEKESKKEKGYKELLNRATITSLLSYTLPDWPYVFLGVLFLIGAAVADIFLPLYTSKVISGIVVSKSYATFTKNILIMALLSLTKSICAGLRAGFFLTVMQKLNIRVRNALFASITSQEIGFFDNMKTGDITSRLTSDTTTMSDTIGLNCNIFLRNVIRAIGVCVFMFSLSWRMSIITFMGLPVVFAVSEIYGKYYKKLQKQVQDRFALANEVAEEVCSSMQTVRSFANESGEKNRYHTKLQDVYKVQIKQAIAYSGFIWTTQSIELMLTVATLWFGGLLLIKEALSAENFIAFVLYQETLGECFSEIGEVYTGLMQALGAAEKVFELIQRKPVLSTNDGSHTPKVRGRISFKNVSFSYPTRPDQSVLQNVSFDVEPGEVVALVGPSGGGKSSCVKLLQRFYDPVSGSVLLDGVPIKSFKHEYLHEKISLVGQEPVLYARSVRDNIAYGMQPSTFSESDILEAAKKSNCHQFIMDLPQQYDTETGEKGTQLSGGQKQRVAIARALVRNPTVLLLDEATSALDTESEYLVQEALERSKSDRTVLLIAHRLSTVERADRIIVIDKGQVKEVGNHQELMKKQGMYYKLVHRQLHASAKKDATEETSAPGWLDTMKKDFSRNDDLSTSLSSCSSSVGSLRLRV